MIAPSGFTTTEDFAVTVDREAPEIALDPLLPWLTAEGALRVAGTHRRDAHGSRSTAPRSPSATAASTRT